MKVSTDVEMEIFDATHMVRVHANYSAGRPMRMYMPNGDPGYPEDPAEMEITKVEIIFFRKDRELEVTGFIDDLPFSEEIYDTLEAALWEEMEKMDIHEVDYH